MFKYERKWKLWILWKEYYGKVNESYIINKDTSFKQRKLIIQQFSDGPDDCLKVIINCKCLNQSIDISKCDSTFIGCCSENSSEIVMFQRFMRASRIDSTNKNKINHCFLWSDQDDFSSLEKVIMKLKISCKDDMFDSKIKIINQSYDHQDSKEIKNNITIKQHQLNEQLINWTSRENAWFLRFNIS